MAYGFERDVYGGGDSAADVIRGTVAAWLWAADQYGRVMDFAADYLTDKAVRLGLERLGVTVPEGETVNADAIGKALGVMLAAETGIQVDNVLDAASVRDALRREAVRAVAESLGLSGVSSADGIAAALAGDVRQFVERAAQGQEQELLDSVKVSDYAVTLALRGAVRTVPASTRPDAQANRERQDRWRAKNRRVKA